MCLLAGGIVERAGGVVHLSQQPLRGLEMVRNRGICWFRREGSVTIDGDVVPRFAGVVEAQTKYRKQNESRGCQAECGPRPMPSQEPRTKIVASLELS